MFSSQPNSNYPEKPLFPVGVAERDVSGFMSRVYGWMMLGLFITGAVAFYFSSNQQLFMTIVQNKPIFWVLIILQLGAVIVLSAAMRKLSVGLATSIYLLYSALTGVTFSAIFLAYTQQSIFSAFAVTSIAFGGLSLFGYVTKRDLGPVGSFCMMGLFGMIGVMILGFFVPSLMGSKAQMIISAIGVIVFAGLTAYDTQRIKQFNNASASMEETKKAAIFGALMLYLDFINLFLSILRLMGQRR